MDNRMFELSIGILSRVLESADDRARILLKKDDEAIDQESSNEASQIPGNSTSSLHIEKHNLDNRQVFINSDQVCRDNTIPT